MSAPNTLWSSSSSHTEPAPYWAHEVGFLGERLLPAEAAFVSELLGSLRQPGQQYVLACYPAEDESVEQLLGPSPCIRRTMPRGVFFKRHTVLWVAGVTEPTAAAVELSWRNLAGNDTLLWCAGDAARVLAWLDAKFIDDVEANPLNEVALVQETGATVASRGWDGAWLRVYSATWDESRFSGLVASLAARSGYRVGPPPPPDGG